MAGGNGLGGEQLAALVRELEARMPGNGSLPQPTPASKASPGGSGNEADELQACLESVELWVQLYNVCSQGLRAAVAQAQTTYPILKDLLPGLLPDDVAAVARGGQGAPPAAPAPAYAAPQSHQHTLVQALAALTGSHPQAQQQQQPSHHHAPPAAQQGPDSALLRMLSEYSGRAQHPQAPQHAPRHGGHGMQAPPSAHAAALQAALAQQQAYAQRQALAAHMASTGPSNVQNQLAAMVAAARGGAGTVAGGAYANGGAPGSTYAPPVDHGFTVGMLGKRMRSDDSDLSGGLPATAGGGLSGGGGSRQCHNCGISNTPFWRKDRVTGQPLCNACGLYAAKNDHPRPMRLWREGQIPDYHAQQAIVLDNESPPGRRPGAIGFTPAAAVAASQAAAAAAAAATAAAGPPAFLHSQPQHGNHVYGAPKEPVVSGTTPAAAGTGGRSPPRSPAADVLAAAAAAVAAGFGVKQEPSGAAGAPESSAEPPPLPQSTEPPPPPPVDSLAPADAATDAMGATIADTGSVDVAAMEVEAAVPAPAAALATEAPAAEAAAPAPEAVAVLPLA